MRRATARGGALKFMARLCFVSIDVGKKSLIKIIFRVRGHDVKTPTHAHVLKSISIAVTSPCPTDFRQTIPWPVGRWPAAAVSLVSCSCMIRVVVRVAVSVSHIILTKRLGDIDDFLPHTACAADMLISTDS